MKISRPVLFALILVVGCSDPSFFLSAVNPLGEPDGIPRPLDPEKLFGRGQVIWWHADSLGVTDMQPVVDGTIVYVQTRPVFSSSGQVLKPNMLQALNRATGALIWNSEVPQAEKATTSGNALAGASSSITLLDRITGARIGDVESGRIFYNIVGDGQRFFAATRDGHVLAVNNDGSPAFDVSISDGGLVRGDGVQIVGDALFAEFSYVSFNAGGIDSMIVLAMNKTSGVVLWRQAVGEPNRGYRPFNESPVVANGIVVVKVNRHELHAFDATSGAPRWVRDVHYPTQDPTGSYGLAACDGIVITATDDLATVALDITTGAVKWKSQPFDSGSNMSMECSHGTVIMLSGYMVVLDARTGALKVRYPKTGPDESAPIWISAATRDETSFYISSTGGFARVRVP